MITFHESVLTTAYNQKPDGMKTQLLSSLLIICLLFTQSCSRSNDDTTNPNSQAQIQNITSGTWRVTLFTDSGNDETSDFASYSFQFNSGGTITATKGSTTKNGTWSITSSSNKYNIDLGAKSDSNKPLGELTDDWKIISISSTEIKLSDDNASSNELLTFTKN
jgi:hypothetical protein